MIVGGLLAWPALAATKVAVIDVTGPIGPATSSYVERSFSEVRDRQFDLVVLRLDTPGGLVTSMRSVIKTVLASPVPVVGFVAPSGAHAASAGTYILYATHIAAMAPGTNLGAATPVRLGDDQARDRGEDDQSDIDGATATIEDKIVNDAVGYIRSLADLRGRNAEWAERAVREAASLPAGDALKLGVIDLVANDVAQLLARLDGRAVEVNAETRILDLTDRDIVEFAPGWRTKLLGAITDPTIAYVLVLVAIAGILTEFAMPGLILPGVVGTISLLAALYAFQVLPVNFVGLGIILLGIVLMGIEITLPSFGVIGFGGIVAFVIGSIFLIDSDVPGYGVSRSLIGILAVVTSSLLMMFLIWISRLYSLPVLAGPEGLVDSSATVISWRDGSGRVRMRGTSWAARSKTALRRGQKVRVTAVDGLTVDVEPEKRGGG